MLKTLYTSKLIESNEASKIYEVLIDKNHQVFDGHFPQQPVLPGVAQIAIISNLLEEEHKAELALTESKKVKFLHIIDPTKNGLLQFTITTKAKDENHILANATITADENICLKFSGKFQKL